MGMVSEQPQYCVAIFRRYHRRKGEKKPEGACMRSRNVAKLEDIGALMREAREKTGIYGWTVIPFEGKEFFDVVLCDARDKVNVVKKMIQERFSTRNSTKSFTGTLHLVGGDSREEAREVYIRNVREKAGVNAYDYLAMVPHNVRKDVLEEARRQAHPGTPSGPQPATAG